MMGWLGPRGLASVVFGLVAYEAFLSAAKPTWLLLETVGWTVLLSVVLHGLLAVPLANGYARRLANAPPDAPELAPVEDIRLKRRVLAPGGADTPVTEVM
jgi:NhaP-type Na+/H+ or K+/H+ antiporter